MLCHFTLACVSPLLCRAEGGLMRDMFTHKITTAEHWNMLMMPTVYSRDELDYDRVVGRNTRVTPTYDPHCADGDVTQGCQPVAVISAEVLRDYTEGPSETAKIANVLNTDERMQPFVIAQEAWDVSCLLRSLCRISRPESLVFSPPSPSVAIIVPPLPVHLGRAHRTRKGAQDGRFSPGFR